MKRFASYLIILLNFINLTSCTSPVKHDNPFYNVNDDFSMNRIPLIDPIEVNRLNSSSPWDLELHPGMWVDFPNSKGLYYLYGHVHELEKFSVENSIIMVYSSYVDKEADAFIQNNFSHWFVIVPSKDITEGFHTEEEFQEYIKTMGVEDPDWQTPDEAFALYSKTGCLDWFPDCE